jgi:ADP-ribose pyrophosphatase YjhB (NUDIX family)
VRGEPALGRASDSIRWMDPQWLRWARELQAIAQVGQTFAGDSHFDRERYHRVQQIAAEMTAAGTGLDIASVAAFYDAEHGYATPKVDVRGVVFDADRLLLVREASDGLWTLPGGWADVNEAPGPATVREIREESGFETRPVKLLAILDRSLHPHEPPFPYHVYKLFIRCDLLGGTAASSAETTAAAFFGEDELPPLSLSRVTETQIRRMFAHHRHPDWPADFD